MGFTSRQQIFILEYFKDANAQAAATVAGYSPSFVKSKAYLLPKQHEIKAELERMRAEYITNFFQDTAIEALQTIQEILKAGDTSTSQLRAAELILKQIGIITDKVDINQKVNYEITFTN